MNLRNPLPFFLRVIALSLPLLGSSWAQTTYIWEGPNAGSLNTSGYWAPDPFPDTNPQANPDTTLTNVMQWNGVVGGNLSLTYASPIGNNSTSTLFNNGLGIHLTSAQTGSVTINSTISGGQTFRIRGVTIDSGAGAFTVGDQNTGKVNIYLGGPGAWTTPTYTNNSSNTAILGSNIQVLGTGNNDRRTWVVGGSGNWDVSAPISNSTAYNSVDVTLQKSGELNLTKSGNGTLKINNALNTYSGILTIDGGTLQAASNTALGWGATMLSLENNALNVVNGTSVSAAGTLDLINNITVNEVITLNTGAQLINSQVGTTSTIQNGLAGVVLNTNGSGYTPNLNFAVSIGGGGTGGTLSAFIGDGTTTLPNPQGIPNTVGGTSMANNVNSITLTNAGSGYTSAVTNVAIAGGTGATYSTVLSELKLIGSGSLPNGNRIGGAGDLLINANVSGAGGFAKIGTGTLTLTGLNSYTFATFIDAGVVSVATIGNGTFASNLGASTAGALGLHFRGGTLRYTGATATSDRAFTIISGATATIDVTTNNLSLVGATDPATTGALTKIGNGTLTLTGVSNYTGLTTVSQGTLAYGTNDMLASGAVTVNGTGTLALGTFSDTLGAVTLTSGSITGSTGVLTGTSYAVQSGSVSAILAGSGAVTKSTGGSVTFSAVNTYTGSTLVSAGTLVLSGSGSIAGSNTVDVGTGAVLNTSAVGTYTYGSTQTVKGTGTIIGNTLLQGTLAAGNSPGVLTFNNDLTLASTTDSIFEIQSGTPMRGTTFDGVNVGGILTYDGDLILSMTTLISNGTYDLFSFTPSHLGTFDSVAFSGGGYTGGFTYDGSNFYTATSNGQVFSFGLASGDLIVSAIPEPSTTLLLAGALTALLIFRRRRA